jgi:ketosteroid isomerase-like protein
MKEAGVLANARRFLIASMVLALACASPRGGEARSVTTAQRTAEFTAFLDEVDAAQIELQNGRAERFKALWSRSDDITLSGGFGGTIEKGWQRISERLDWVASQYSNGRTQRERVAVNAGTDLAYVVQHEHIQFRVPGQDTDSTRDYRVTMIFRKESAGWKLVHRQADSQMQKRAPQ